MGISKSRITASLSGVLLCGPISAQATQLVSVNSRGVQGNQGGTPYGPSISSDCRYVAFDSLADNLVHGDTNGALDVFVRDRQGGTTERVSISSSGTQGNGHSDGPSISADGRYVAFESWAYDFVPGDTNGGLDIYVRDRRSGTTDLVSVSSSGAQGNDASYAPSISADGSFVVFVSFSDNLVAGGTNGSENVFVRDLQTGTTELASLSSVGAQGNDNSGDDWRVSISADGRYVAFTSVATNLVPGGTNGLGDVFLRDRQLGTTELMSVSSSGVHGNYGSFSSSISPDGRYVAFVSDATNLVQGDTNGFSDIFLRDRQNSTTELISVDSSGMQGNDGSYVPSISADSRYVAFGSFATNLVPGDTNHFFDLFVRDRRNGTTGRVSVASDGAQGNSESSGPSISADGRYVGFSSSATNLVHGDANSSWVDIFVRDRLGGMSFTSLCDPGIGGVIACPCSNAPSGPGRGCENSFGTGGAALSALGGAFVSSDSLMLITSGEGPTSTSLVMQGTTSLPSGIVFGQGIRCVAGSLARLYSKTAVGGSVRVPDFGVHDLQVSVRSAALGDVILAGQSRWYFVYYRDVNVVGGCDAWRMFNATQTGQVTWWP